MRNRSSSLPLTAAAIASLALLGAGCGNVSTSRDVARDQATTATCDWYAMCGQIGSSGDGGAPKYETRSSCETQVRGSIEAQWPPADCDGKISQPDLDLCLSAIRGTDCSNIFDIGFTLAKCSKDNVCSAK
jgi:hypothetical protein